MTRAAHRLNLTQSALSHQLLDIEGRLGAPLFERRPRQMLLTPAGERVLESAHSVLAQLEAVESEIREASFERQGLIRVATECYTCYHWLPAQLQAFHRRYPAVEVRIEAQCTRRPVQGLLAGEIDLGIVSDPVRNRKVALEPLFDDELYLILAPDDPLARRKFVNAADFSDLHLLLYCDEKKDLTIYQELLIPAGVSPKRMSNLELTEAILEMVQARMGASVMAGWAAAPWVEEGRVRAVRITRRGLKRHWKAATLRSGGRTAHLDEFIQILAQTAPDRTVRRRR